MQDSSIPTEPIGSIPRPLDSEEQNLRSVALQNAREILAARQRAEEQVLQTKAALEATSRELAHRLAMARATLESTADGILVTDAAGEITDFNDKYVQMWRLDSAALASRNHADVLRIISRQFADPAAFLARVDAIYAANERDTLDVLNLADGRIYERFSTIQSIDGRNVGRVWSFRNITERVRAQGVLEQKVIERTEALRTSEVQFQQLVAGVNDCAIYMLDRGGHVITWNPGAARIKGYTQEEIAGRHFSTFYTQEDRARGAPDRTLAIAASEGKYEAEGWRIRKDGTQFWASILVDAIRGPDGTLVGFAKITRDMTERRVMQEQLNQSQKMEAIGQLTGGVAHDFNNLLTVILGNLETIVRQIPADDGRLRRAVDQATRGAQRAATLTQQLLAFSRRQPLNPKPTDINRLVTGMSDLIRRTLSEHISIETVLAGGLWRVEVDPNQLENALLNLAVNSRDAMPAGGKLTLETANSHLDESYAARYAEIAAGQYVVICVSDTGTGMAPEVMARAFDPFFTTKPLGEGTGLGLSQVFGFVKQSGGHVKLYSEVGQGTTVKIYLPRLIGEAEVVEDEAPAVVPRGVASETILVVEDDDDVRIYSTESLRELGFTVLEAHDGPSALRVLEHHPEVKMLFTDVGLPGMNGRELVEEARRRQPGLPVLFTTGYARNAIVHQGRLDRGVELLTKPFTRAQLAGRIRDVLDSGPQPQPGQTIALVVDDEPLVRAFLSDALTEAGFQVIQAASAREGLTVAERHSEIVVAFVDIGLPDRNGVELAADFRRRWPEMKIAIASGYGDQASGRLRGDPQVTFLAKPFRAATIDAALRALGLPQATGAAK